MHAVNNASNVRSIGTIGVPCGQVSVDRGSAVDRGTIVGNQLTALLVLMRADDASALEASTLDTKLSLLMLAQHLAEEVTNMIPLIAADALPAGAA